MKLALKIASTLAGNALALWLCNRYIAGFVVADDWRKLLGIALLLALLNFFVRPALKLLLGPIILLTLGLGLIVVNAVILYLLPLAANHLDSLKGSITIETIPALIYGTILVSLVNWLVHLIA